MDAGHHAGLILTVAAALAATLVASLIQSSANSAEPQDEIARLVESHAREFSGVVLVVHNGNIVVHRAYGKADRGRRIPNTRDTLFCIGSTPIGFTKAAILLLQERGTLKVTDPITAYFDDVPEDKHTITIRQLMTGMSGLRDFHDHPTDTNADLTWIDRETAVSRILSFDLLFEPGVEQRHSHSGWGLLAAIVEIASGQTYGEFLQEHLLDPAGMVNTGFYGDRRFPPERFAVGYGGRTAAEINSPYYWGPTSWLVMGSGGMVSTCQDLYRWHTALRDGDLLSQDSLDRYWARPGALLNGGSMHGFETFYTEGPGSFMYLCTNSIEQLEEVSTFVRELSALVTERQRLPFSLGIRLGRAPGGHMRLTRVVTGGAAEEYGLRSGDVILSVNGEPLLPNPLAALDPALRYGEPMTFDINRDGELISLVVRPRRRD